MDNVLRLCFQKEPLTLDPQRSGDRTSSAIIFLLFKGLTRLEADHRISYDLAASVYTMNNHTKYVFELGDHVWEDGRPITAGDFVYSWKRALARDFSAGAINLFHYLKNAKKAKKGLVGLEEVGVRAKGEKTLEVDLEFPCPYFLELTSFCPFFPVASHAKDPIALPICSGPFFLYSRNPQTGDFLLKKNPLCQNRSTVYLDGIHIKIIPDEKQAFDAFEKGELDWLGNPVSPLPHNYLPALLSQKKLKPIAGLTLCWFNTREGPFTNLNLRKAIFHAIPREKLLDKLLLPDTLATHEFCPSFPKGEEVPRTYCKQSVAKNFFLKAQKELGEKLQAITLSYEETAEFSRIALFLKGHWEKMFNTPVYLQALSFKEFWHRMPLQHYQVSLGTTITQYTDAMAFLEMFEYKNTSTNFSGWENLKYQDLLQRYRAINQPEKRKKLQIKAEKILSQEVPIAPIHSFQYAYLQKPYLKNLAISPIGIVQFDRVVLEKRWEMSPLSLFAINQSP